MIKPLTTILRDKLLKTSALLVFVFVVNQNSQAQLTELTNQDKVAEFLGDERFNDLLTSNPSYLTFLDTKCSYGYKIVEMGSEKTEGMTVLNSITYEEWVASSKSEEQILYTSETILTPEEFVENATSPEFNILKYHFNSDRKQIVYYVLGTTGKVIILYPVAYIAKQSN